ncbi:hypothetical protein ACFQ1M_03000 [Sungkyunkwania multivorans]|uniref:Outer membrane protein beta-barrel domain-containing protein n=1 Tax=Sungkyunkwania multivorans TaxID=1173618 RepID=A0ABW3CTT9_9FLAO
MKSLIISFSFALICLNCYSQKLSGNFEFKNSITAINQGELLQYREGHRIKVIDTSDSKVKFQYYKFSSGSEKAKLLNNKYYYSEGKEEIGFGLYGAKNLDNVVDADDLRNRKIHQITKEEFLKHTIKIYPRFKGVRAGIFTIPFKLRLDDFDFEQNVTIGMNTGFQFRMNKYQENKWIVEGTLGIGLSKVSLNPENSDLTVADGEDANRSANAFSLSLGAMIHLSESINVGIQLGKDFLGNEDKNINWKYDRKTWLGIGINIGFSLSESKEGELENKG